MSLLYPSVNFPDGQSWEWSDIWHKLKCLRKVFTENTIYPIEGKPFIEVLFEEVSLLFSLILGVWLFLPHLLEFNTVHSLFSGFESLPLLANLDSLCFSKRSRFNILSFDKHTSCFSSSKFLTELDSSFSNNLKDLCCYYTK